MSYQYGDVAPARLTELRHASGAQQGQAYATYTYDAAGNQTQRSIVGEANWEYMFDGQDRLRRVVKKSPAGVVQGSEEYWYTAAGHRMLVQKRDAAGAKTELLWFIGETQAHYDANGNVNKTYAHIGLGTPIVRVARDSNVSTSLEYQFQGLSGDVVAAVAADGTVNASMVYAPYGELVSVAESGNGNGLAVHWRRFNDKFKDEISELAYYGARYYDNVSLLWTQADPLYRKLPEGDQRNFVRTGWYTFTANNPVSYTDPDGRMIVLDGQNDAKTAEMVTAIKEIVGKQASVETEDSELTETTEEGKVATISVTIIRVFQTPAQQKGRTSPGTKHMLDASTSESVYRLVNLNSTLEPMKCSQLDDIKLDKKYAVSYRNADGVSNGGAATAHGGGNKIWAGGKLRVMKSISWFNFSRLDREAIGVNMKDMVPLTEAGTMYHELIGHGFFNGNEHKAIQIENEWRRRDWTRRGADRGVPPGAK